MRRFIATMTAALCFFGLLAVASLPTSAQSSIFTETGSTGFQAVATQSLTIATDTAILIGVMPPNCRELTVIASGANICYGDASVDTNGLYPFIEDGKSQTFTNISTRNPSIYFRAVATDTGKIGILAR